MAAPARFFTVVGIDIGTDNSAIAEVVFPTAAPGVSAPLDDPAALAALPFLVKACVNLHLGGGTATALAPVLYDRLRSSGWLSILRDVDVVVIELQNGHRAPQNFAVQAMFHAMTLCARGDARGVYVMNNAQKLHTMALYGLIADRDLPDPKDATGKRKRATHHYNKVDVVKWFRAAHPEVPLQGEKVDDQVDAITHALAWMWQALESATLRRRLGRRTRCADPDLSPARIDTLRAALRPAAPDRQRRPTGTAETPQR